VRPDASVWGGLWQGEPYVTLMASLPAIGLLAEKALPINRARLAERLKALAPEDRALVDLVRSIMSWETIATGDDDAAYLGRAATVLAEVDSAPIRAAIEERLELRTLLAALRRRRDGEEAPPADAAWGFGRHLRRIRANWSLPDFGLAAEFPWLPRANECLEKDETAELERLILEVAWEAIAKRAVGHEFDREAVAFYLMRWALADRWACYDADAAAVRFGEMLEAAVAGAVDQGRRRAA
jgi:hypothetical protein